MSATAPPGLRAYERGASAGDRSRHSALVGLVAAVTVLIASGLAAPWIVPALADGAVGGVRPSGSVAGQGAGGGMMNRAWSGGMMGPGWSGSMMGPGWSGGMMGSGGAPGMMSGRVWLAGDGVTVSSISAARARAARAAAAVGLHPGEIIQFSQNYYSELKDASGASVTEVLVNPETGAVITEPGPAMMWNTGSRAASVSSGQARAIATAWLQANRGGETVTSIDAYPGYYTLDTASGGTPMGMLSVNAATGALWYHTWHGSFVAKEDS